LFPSSQIISSTMGTLKLQEGAREVLDFDPSLHNIISLDKIMNKDEATLAELHRQFSSRGFCFVLFPTATMPGTSEFYITHESWEMKEGVLDLLHAFFKQEDKEKLANTDSNYGYSKVEHKEGLHLLTGYKWENFSLPPALVASLSRVSYSLDDFSMSMIESYFVPQFGMNKATVAHKADLPLAFGGAVGMLDIAHYFNRTTAQLSPSSRNIDEVNCVPHYDPGLFSVSFLSTLEGLQLYDPEQNTWFAGPVNTHPGQENIGVIWLGEAAVRVSDGKLKGGVHRVVYPRISQPRLTMWYEACTVNQVNAPQVEYQGEQVNLPNVGISLNLNEVGSTHAEVTKYVERFYGIPESKIMMREDDFNVNYSEDFIENGGLSNIL